MKSRPSREEAEILAIRALEWIAADPERLGGWLGFAGLEPEGLGTALRDPEARAQTLGGALDWLLGDESALLAFCAEARLAPEAPMAARRLLPGFPEERSRDWA